MQEVDCAAEVGGKQAGDKAQADDWFTLHAHKERDWGQSCSPWKVLVRDAGKEAGKIPKGKHPSSVIH